MRSKIFVLLTILVGLLLVVSFGCKKKGEEKDYEIEVEEPTTEAETEEVEASPVGKITETKVVEETLSIINPETAVKQCIECYDATIELLGWPENEYLCQQLLVKNSTLLSALTSAFEGSEKTIVDNALSDTETYVSRLDASQKLGSGEVDTMKTTLRKHRRNLNSLITSPTVTKSKDKKLSDYYTDEELEKMKKKWKEYGDDLKRRYKEMHGD